MRSRVGVRWSFPRIFRSFFGSVGLILVLRLILSWMIYWRFFKHALAAQTQIKTINMLVSLGPNPPIYSLVLSLSKCFSPFLSRLVLVLLSYSPYLSPISVLSSINGLFLFMYVYLVNQRFPLDHLFFLLPPISLALFGWSPLLLLLLILDSQFSVYDSPLLKNSFFFVLILLPYGLWLCPPFPCRFLGS